MPDLFPQKPHLRHIINSYNLIQAVAEHDPIGWPKIPILRLAMSVMNEQLQRLALSSRPARPDVADPCPCPGRTRSAESYPPFSASTGPREAARHDAVSTGRLANAFPLDGRKGSYLRGHLTALAMAPFDLGRCQELSPKTTESHWSGGQREP